MITQQQLIQLLEYNPDTGVFRWKKQPSPKARVSIGGVAGTVGNRGYRRIGIAGKQPLAQRLAWFYTYGVWPVEVDHINGQRDDNRLSNLRNVDTQTNSRNKSRRLDNASGLSGVRWMPERNKWQSYISFAGKRIHLGLFDNLLDAAAARKSAELRFGFHPNHGR